MVVEMSAWSARLHDATTRGGLKTAACLTAAGAAAGPSLSPSALEWSSQAGTLAYWGLSRRASPRCALAGEDGWSCRQSWGMAQPALETGSSRRTRSWNLTSSCSGRRTRWSSCGETRHACCRSCGRACSGVFRALLLIAGAGKPCHTRLCADGVPTWARVGRDAAAMGRGLYRHCTARPSLCVPP